MKTLNRILIIALICTVVLRAQAQQNPKGSEPQPEATALDVQRTAAALTQTCVGCHGNHGEGHFAADFPRLAGLGQIYILSQLNDYDSGVRPNNIMGPIAKSLNEADRKTIAQYYSDLQTPFNKPAFPKKTKENAELLKRGELLVNHGDQKLSLQGCMNCHGPLGVGNAPAIPFLAGQNLDYMTAQLVAWQKDERKNSPTQMLDIAKKLTTHDIKGIMLYLDTVKH